MLKSSRRQLEALGPFVVLLAAQQLPAPEPAPSSFWRLGLFAVGACTLLLLHPLSSLAGTLVGVALRERLTALRLGAGPRIATFFCGSVWVQLRLLPVRVGSAFAPLVLSRARRTLMVVAGPLATGLLVLLATSGPYEKIMLVGWGYGAALWLLVPLTAGGQSQISTAVKGIRGIDRQELAEYAEFSEVEHRILSGELDAAKAEMARLRTAGRPAAVTESLEGLLALVQGDYARVLTWATAARQRDWGDSGGWSPFVHQKATGLLSDAVARAAEAGELPLVEAVSQLNALLGDHADDSWPGTRAMRAVLVGEWEVAAALAREAVDRQQPRWSLADELCTLAVAEAGCGHRREAEAALARARRLAPDLPRLAAVRRRLELHQVTAVVGADA